MANDIWPTGFSALGAITDGALFLGDDGISNNGYFTAAQISTYLSQTTQTLTNKTWNGAVIGAVYGGTGVANNSANTITFSGSYGLTLTLTNTTSVTLPTSGTLVNTGVTTLSSLTTVGTIGTGTWQGSVVAPAYGGTGVANNSANTITFTGSYSLGLTLTGNTSVTLPTSGTLLTSSATTLASLSTVGTIGTGTWQATVIAPAYGGTGVANNAANTLTFTGNYSLGLTLSANTAVTLPTSGTLLSTASTITVAQGGTGQTTLTNHGVLVGAGTSGVTQLTAAAAGTILTGQGASADPSFSATPTFGVAGTTAGTLTLANAAAGSATFASDGANILAQRSSTSAQTLRVYNTYTSSSNYEVAIFDWQATSNTLSIGTQAAGAGVVRNIAFVGGSVTLGTALATTLNGNTFTTGTYTLTGASGKTLTFNNSITLAGTDSTTMTFPSSSDTVVTLAATQTLTNKTLTSPTINSATMTTPSLGVATATSINGNTFTTGTYTLTGASGKTLTFNNSITLAGTDSTTMTFPSTSSTVLTVGNTGTITVGYTITPYNGGTISSGTYTPAAANGNYQYITNNGAFTMAVPAADSAIDILVTNGASAGTITFSGSYTVGSNTGSTYATTNGNKYILSIRRINSVSTYLWYSLQ